VRGSGNSVGSWLSFVAPVPVCVCVCVCVCVSVCVVAVIWRPNTCACEKERAEKGVVRRRVLQCVAVCCSVLQCVAVCCSVLHCDERRTWRD